MNDIQKRAKKYIKDEGYEGADLNETHVEAAYIEGFESRQPEVDKLKQLVEELQELNSILNRKQ
jgi:hypothetical protein